MAKKKVSTAAKKDEGITLFGNRLLVDVLKPDDKSKGGVLLPGSVREGSFKKAVVRVVGQGTAMDDGTFVDPIVNVGDHILLPATVGVLVDMGEEKLYLVKEPDVIGVLK